jgi:Ser/Thr protein kinase RdoA (MazF antagonist)
MQTLVIERIVKKYGVRDARIFGPQKGYRNESYPIRHTGSQPLNLILYKSEPEILERIKRANNVSDYAASTGLPTRKTLGKPIVHLSAGQFHKYGALYNYLPGKTIPWEAYTKDHIKLLGAALSTLHFRLRAMEPDGLSAVETEYLHIHRRMNRYFDTPGVQRAIKTKLKVSVMAGHTGFEPLLAAAAKLPGRQALHMDFVRSNILFGPAADDSPLRLDDLAITGILDFEKTACGSRLFDIARTLAFLLVDCKFKSEDKVRKYFLYSGYQKRGESKLPSLTLLEELINLFLLHDFYKFLRHNPYEFLDQNEHFVRTRDLLIRRGLLTASGRRK